MVALSPDGRRLVYAGSDRLYVLDLAEGDARPIAGTERRGEVTEPAFSPDGRTVAYWSGLDRTIRTVPVGGGTPAIVARAENPFGLSWSAAGLVYGARAQGVLQVPIAGGAPRLVAAVDAEQQAHGPQRLPGGALLFTIATGSAPTRWDTARVVVQTPDGARRTVLDNATDARYVPTGHLIYAARDGVHAVRFDLDRLAVTGPITTTLEGVRRSSGRRTGAAQFAVSDTGAIVYVPGAIRRGSGSYAESGAATEIAIGDRDGRIERLPLPPGPYRAVRVSPDGRRLAIAWDDGVESAIYVIERARPTLRRLTTSGGARAPVWTADGRRIVFQSDREGSPAIYWQLADGSGPAERLTTPRPGEVHEPDDWRPGGVSFLYSVRTARDTSLWEMTIADRRGVPFGDVTSSILPGATFSPDGRWVAYVTAPADSGTSEIVVQPYPATGARYPLVVAQPAGGPTNSPHKPLWTPDGRSLLYVPRMGEVERVAVSTTPAFTFGRAAPLPRRFQPAPPDARRSHDVLPDGRIIGLVSSEPTLPDEYARTTLHVVLHWIAARDR
jgi:Tol biopolymer transport system component